MVKIQFVLGQRQDSGFGHPFRDKNLWLAVLCLPDRGRWDVPFRYTLSDSCDAPDGSDGRIPCDIRDTRTVSVLKERKKK